MKLTQYGYTQRRLHPDFGQIFSITHKGHYWLQGAQAAKLSRPPVLWPREWKLRHTLIVAACGIIFSRLLNLEVVNERELVGYSRHPEKARERGFALRTPLPDLLIKHQGRWMRVEVELSEKSRKRYARIWERLRPDSREPDLGIIYVCLNQRLKERILAFAKDAYYPGILAASIEETLAYEHELAFSNFDDHCLRLVKDNNLGGSDGIR